MNILIPMAGLGSRFSKAGYERPKPFIDVNGKPMICKVMENLYVSDAIYTLICREEHRELLEITYKSALEEFNFNTIYLDKLTEGTACTVLHAHKDINTEVPLIIANSDQLVDLDLENYVSDAKSRNLDGSILCFKEPNMDPKWSYARLNEKDLVTEVKEKKAISDNATVGIYYYSKGSHFVNAAIDMIIAQDKVNGEYYTCPAYNYMIQDNLKVGIFEIAQTAMHGLGTPDDLNSYLKLHQAPSN